MLTKLTSFANVGLQSLRITVEIGAVPGEAGLHIVGLGDTAVQESKQRVKMALRSSGFKLPTGKTVTINLAPANIKKTGPRYDLSIALGLLAINGYLDECEDLKTCAFLGELALDGSLRHVNGVLSAALLCKTLGIEKLIVPIENASEALLIPGVEVIAGRHLKEIVEILNAERDPIHIDPPKRSLTPSKTAIDFADIRGQDLAKRALEIAAAGGHNVLLSGAPGAGKTLLAKAFRGILPPISYQESIEVSQIYSLANLLPEDCPLISERPFRTVHHTASGVSIVGGGQNPMPGEISLAHHGVLFLDEIAEFPVQVLEVLRQPLEDCQITITRAQGRVTYPANFTMVAAMNPPEWSSASRKKFSRRISKPLLDRIDMTIDVESVPIEDLQDANGKKGESSGQILERVTGAREAQQKRFQKINICSNTEMSVKEIDEYCPLDEQCKKILADAVNKLGLSARSYHRTIKVARTIGDLAGADEIEVGHVAEALQYRQNIYEEG